MIEDPKALALICAVAGWIVHSILVGFCLSKTKQRFAMPIMAGSAASVFIVTAFLCGQSVAYWHFAAIFGCGTVGTLFLYGAVLKSLSLRMQATLLAAPDNALSIDTLSARVVEPAFAARTELLVQSGMTQVADEKFAITPAGRHTAQRLNSIRRALNIDTLGLYGN